MKLTNYLKKHEYETTEKGIMERILRFEPIEQSPRNVDVYPAYHEDNLTVLKWIDRESGLWGFIRDDNAGWSGIVVFNSRDDEETIAAWNADFDILCLKRSSDGVDWKYIIGLAKESKWGFD